MIRLALSVAGMIAVAFGLFIVTVFNGYCGDSPAAADEGACHFHVNGQAGFLLLGFGAIAGLAVAGASGLPALERRRRWLLAGIAAAICLATPLVLLKVATRISLDHWHEVGGGSSPASVDRLWLASVVVALLTPLAVWLLAGPGRASARLLSYGAAASTAAWLLALSYAAWYYDRNF